MQEKLFLNLLYHALCNVWQKLCFSRKVCTPCKLILPNFSVCFELVFAKMSANLCYSIWIKFFSVSLYLIFHLIIDNTVPSILWCLQSCCFGLYFLCCLCCLNIVAGKLEKYVRGKGTREEDPQAQRQKSHALNCAMDRMGNCSVCVHFVTPLHGMAVVNIQVAFKCWSLTLFTFSSCFMNISFEIMEMSRIIGVCTHFDLGSDNMFYI